MIKLDKKRSLIACLIVISLVILTSIPLFSNINKKVSPEIPLAKLESSAGEITIITPENTTYTGPMSGYYAATYGFENDEIGSKPEEWLIRSDGEPDFEVSVIEDVDGHKNVVEIDDYNTGSFVGILQYLPSPRTYGTIELWMRFNSINDYTAISCQDSTDTYIPLSVRVEDGKWKYRLSAGPVNVPNVADPQVNTWHHVRIDFRCHNAPAYLGISDDRFIVTINGISSGELSHWATGQIDYGRIGINSDPAAIMKTWIDAVGFSWDPNYNIGDNLNEGILLSYDTNIDFNWESYSLDAQANKIILGNATIPMPTGGIHQIQVFGNDTMGTMYESEVRYFTITTIAPGITINSPTDSEIFGSNAPTYDLSIAEPYEAIWYTLNNGVTNNTASGLTGTIDQTEWDKLSDGIVTIIFYVNNSGGFVGSAQVQVVKHVPGGNGGPQIPGYNVIALIGVSCVVTLLILKKQK